MYPLILALLSLFLLLNACADRGIIGEETDEGSLSGTGGGSSDADRQLGGTTGRGGASSTRTGGTGGTRSSSASSTIGGCQDSNMVILTARWSTAPGERALEGEWCNGTDESIFLPGCAMFEGEYLVSGSEWQKYGSFVNCAWEGLARELPPGTTTNQYGIPASSKVLVATRWRLRGTYHVGCTPNETIAKAGCTQQLEVLSNEVEQPAE